MYFPKTLIALPGRSRGCSRSFFQSVTTLRCLIYLRLERATLWLDQLTSLQPTFLGYRSRKDMRLCQVSHLESLEYGSSGSQLPLFPRCFENKLVPHSLDCFHPAPHCLP